MRLTINAIPAAAIATLFLAGCASSSDPYQPRGQTASVSKATKQPETIQVVGSRLKRTVDPDDPNKSTLSPVSVITSEDMANQGYNSIYEALQPMLNIRGGGR